MAKIRIIGGQWKRTPIPVIDNPGLRPTPDRVRETLYNWIGPSIRGLRVLDLFGGTGALGFEAASRAAAEVVIVERDARVMTAIRELKSRLAADSVRLVAGDALSVLAQPARLVADARPFDLVLLDPPFDDAWFERVVPRLPPVLAAAAMLYIEAPAAIEPQQVEAWLANRHVAHARSGRAGQVYYHLFETQTRQESPPWQ